MGVCHHKLLLPLVICFVLMSSLVIFYNGSTQNMTIDGATVAGGTDGTMWWSTPIKQNEDKEKSSEMHRVQARRRRTVQEVCARNGIKPDMEYLEPRKFQYLYVDDKHKLLYCMVPKVACTNWKRVLLILSGKVNTTNPLALKSVDIHEGYLSKYLRTLDTYSEEDIRFRLHTYFKFMFVRNPLERILSAYRNKFTMPYNSYFPKRYGRTIIRKFRKNPSKKSLEKGHDVKFPEFIKYLLDPKTPRLYNTHWREYYKLCLPCITKYDVIGKYETLDEDADFVLQEAGVADMASFPHTPTIKHGHPRTSDLLEQNYMNISSEELHHLWERYSVDFAMFGYEYPDFHRH